MNGNRNSVKEIINNPEFFNFCIAEMGAQKIAAGVYSFCLGEWK